MQIKMRKYVLSFFLLLICLFLYPKNASAADSITNLPYFRYANSIHTPAENTFVMHYGKDTSVEALKGSYSDDELRVNKNTPESIALIKNVGYFNGKRISAKVTLKKKTGEAGGHISLADSESFLSMYIEGEMTVTYEFQDEQGNEIPVETSFNYYGLNRNKCVGYNHFTNYVKYLVASNPTNIRYHSQENENDCWVYFENNKSSQWKDPVQAFQIITKPVSRIETVVKNLDSTPSSLMYDTDFLASPEFSNAEAVDTTVENAGDSVSLHAMQTMPNINHGNAINNMEVDFSLDNFNSRAQYKVKDFSVTRFDGEDVTALFDGQSQDGKNYQIKANAPANTKLYDTVLNYQVNLEWIGSPENPVDKQTLENNYLKLPFTVATTINDKVKPSSHATTAVYYISGINLSYLDEHNSALSSSTQLSGIITDPFDLSDQYPEIKGYYPVEEAALDHGIFKPEIQNLVHYYRKGEPIQFSLENAENPLKISRFTRDRKLAFHFSHGNQENVRLMAKCGNEEKELKRYLADETQGEDTVIFQVPEKWLDKEVIFYMESDTGKKSKEEQRQLALDGGVELILPERLSFGEQEIPSRDKTIQAENQKDVQIRDNSTLDQSHWTIKVKAEKPLASKNGNSLNDALQFRLQGKEERINSADRIVWQGSGSTGLTDQDAIQLLLLPSDEADHYEGVLTWTVEDAPK
ncbi:MucBP domain-containing protein [Enterococcus pallens]|uniref:MucBP domain-containing protein n=1 Tax=Enterococcus pallens ATCC BAA-351 TaxID=1158607 RepID=R2SJX6_9ENTE|nr:MucBP domain-containing protein [Enterococcus pallens]EOH93211.1 hypothetical protein UAU_02854 [Enterococcus pallens ATCC BAA-351]EOU24997.1 hypothetical protein I588_00985 [Enterococcus pallens ATCC BAA-351]